MIAFMSQATLLILAAGMGSRYGGLKQMDPVGPDGETIIDYSIYDAARAGFGKVVFVIRPDFAELFKRELGSRAEKRIAVDYAYQELAKIPDGFKVPEGRQKPWGTAHAVLMARDVIKEPFAMINADDFYGPESFEAMAKHLQVSKDAELADYSMVGYVLRQTLSEHGTVSRGLCSLNPDGTLKEVVETLKISKTTGAAKDDASGKDLSGEEIASMNFWGFTPSVFGHFERLLIEFLKAKSSDLKSEIYVPYAVDQLIHEKKARVSVLKSDAKWFGVTYREDKPHVIEGIRKLVDAGRYPASLKN
jgi:dTDP-glucose pyrophosphorylase